MIVLRRLSAESLEIEPAMGASSECAEEAAVEAAEEGLDEIAESAMTADTTDVAEVVAEEAAGTTEAAEVVAEEAEDKAVSMTAVW